MKNGVDCRTTWAQDSSVRATAEIEAFASGKDRNTEPNISEKGDAVSLLMPANKRNSVVVDHLPQFRRGDDLDFSAELEQVAQGVAW